MGGSRKRRVERVKADTQTVEDLVADVLAGRIRIPDFQRSFRWDADDILKLFDSIYRGYPIGALLLQDARAEAALVELGPLLIEAPECESAWWVVDGQQRLTTLAGVLALPPGREDELDGRFRLYYDARGDRFCRASAREAPPSEWVPVSRLRENSRLLEWSFDWEHRKDEALRQRVFDASSRIREYKVPMYVVTGEERTLKEIFERTNTGGKSLTSAEVFNALFGRGTEEPSTLDELSDRLSELAMGVPDESLLLKCVMASAGLDVTRSFVEHRDRRPEQLEGAVADSLPAIRAALSFLRRDASIPHLALLPLTAPVPVLARFFQVHRDPNARTRELLVRWVWRFFVGGSKRDERTFLRASIQSVRQSDPEATVQSLLDMVPSERPAPFALPERFDPRSKESRITLLALAVMQPRLPENGGLVDVPAALDEDVSGACQRIFPGDSAGHRTAANRILLPQSGSIRACIVDHVRSAGLDTTILSSHAIDPIAAEALVDGDEELFLKRRGELVMDSTAGLCTRLCAWGRPDAPSLAYLLGEERN